MYYMKNCAPRPGATRTQRSSLGTMDQANMGTEKIRNLTTMYSEAEPRSRASGTGEGNLPVIPHHSPSACSWPRGPRTLQHVLQGPRAPWGAGAAGRGAVAVRSLLSPCPEAATAPGARSRGKPEPKNRKHLMQPCLVDRPVGARWRRRPPQAHSQYNVYSPAVHVGRAFECTFLHFFKSIFYKVFIQRSLYGFI